MMDRKPTQTRGMTASLTAIAVALACGFSLFSPIGPAPASTAQAMDVSTVEFRAELDGFVPASVRAEALGLHSLSTSTCGEFDGAVFANLDERWFPQGRNCKAQFGGGNSLSPLRGLGNALQRLSVRVSPVASLGTVATPPASLFARSHPNTALATGAREMSPASLAWPLLTAPRDSLRAVEAELRTVAAAGRGRRLARVLAIAAFAPERDSVASHLSNSTGVAWLPFL